MQVCIYRSHSVLICPTPWIKYIPSGLNISGSTGLLNSQYLQFYLSLSYALSPGFDKFHNISQTLPALGEIEVYADPVITEDPTDTKEFRAYNGETEVVLQVIF